MAVVKRSVSFKREVWEQIARITGDEGSQVSALVNAALDHYLRLRQGLNAVREWEAEYGSFTPEELTEADRVLDQAGVTGNSPRPPWPA